LARAAAGTEHDVHDPIVGSNDVRRLPADSFSNQS
jgi:hypothetical protein